MNRRVRRSLAVFALLTAAAITPVVAGQHTTDGDSAGGSPAPAPDDSAWGVAPAEPPAAPPAPIPTPAESPDDSAWG
jgi:hypothetical protein